MRRTASRATLAAGLLAAAAILPLGHSAVAAPVQFGSSYYEFVLDEAVSWDEANTSASGRTFNGVNGHLATVTSSAENDFLLGLVTPFPTPQGAWLGGAVDASQQASWVVGPEAGQLLTFNNFGAGQPNEGPGNFYMNVGTILGAIATGQWADAANGINSGANQITGYFVEYQVSAVPLPAALPFMITALGGLGFVGWRRKRTAAA